MNTFIRNIKNLAGESFSLYKQYSKDIEDVFSNELEWEHIIEKNILIVKDTNKNIIEDVIFCILVKDEIICNNLTYYASQLIRLLNKYDEKDLTIYIYPTEKINKKLLKSLTLVLYETGTEDASRYTNNWINDIDEDLKIFFSSIVSEYLAIELCQKNILVSKFYNQSLLSNPIFAIEIMHVTNSIAWIGDNLKKDKEFILSIIPQLGIGIVFECALELLSDNDILDTMIITLKLDLDNGKETLQSVKWFLEDINNLLLYNYPELYNNKNFILFINIIKEILKHQIEP